MSIEGEMDELLDRFAAAATGLFEITGRYVGAFEKGMYGCAIAKPTKRMRAALSADRELLVVASNFTDQQQRTVKFVKREIEKSGGRFEPTVAIVIHKDPDGNRKLRNWGRDQGLSILPVYGLKGPTTSEELERSLCYELYSHDPFDVAGPVSDDANFYGRRDEAIDLARKLQKGQIRACLGIRKVGKTSIINRILREIRGNYDALCLMVDCSRDDIWEMDAAKTINSIRESVESGLQTNSAYLSITPVSSDVGIKTARDGLEKAVLGCSRPLILVFDEIDYITPGSPTSPQWRTEFNPLWRNLRSIYQECDRQDRIMSMLIGGVSTYWFTVESIDGIENAALSFVPEEYLSPMPEGATVAMLGRLGKTAGLYLEEDASIAIARATGNMPYWARKSGSYIHRQIPTNERPCKIGANRIQPLIDSFVEEEGAAIAEVALRHLFRVHPQLGSATASCCSGQGSSVPEPLKRALRRYGVLSDKDRLAGTMLARAFSSLQLDEMACKGDVSPNISPRLGLGEWAEEIAALGQRRNLLERRLRELAVNFIRYDALRSGKKSDVKDRIVAVLPESRRAELRHLSAEDAVNKLNWTDLVVLVSREWPLFERLLGDKSAFTSHASVINDRFDAHAKLADAADIALYRRSLVHLEERIATIQ